MPGAAPATHAQQSSLLYNDRTVMHCVSRPGGEQYFRLQLLHEASGQYQVFRLSHEDMAALVQCISTESRRAYHTLRDSQALVGDVEIISVITLQNPAAL